MSSSLVLEFNDFRLPCPPEMLASMEEAERAKLERWCLVSPPALFILETLEAFTINIHLIGISPVSIHFMFEPMGSAGVRKDICQFLMFKLDGTLLSCPVALKNTHRILLY
jgi:hypothetical protein